MREIPSNGFGYLIENTNKCVQVSFNYLGDYKLNQTEGIRESKYKLPFLIDTRGKLPGDLQINGFSGENGLGIRIETYFEGGAETFAEKYEQNIKGITAELRKEGNEIYIPEDFTSSDISIDDLNTILGM